MSKKEKANTKSSTDDSRIGSLEIGNVVYTTRLTNKFKNRALWNKPDENRIEAVIPGNIQKIMAREGDEVSAGTPLLILEAMKMRNEVLSPINGVVKKIHVREGEMVPKSHLLIEMD